MPRLSRHAAVLVGSLSVTALLATATPAVADTTLTFRDLGAPVDQSMPGRTATTTLTLPVPDGLIPTELTGTLQVPASFSRGVVEVSQDNRVIGRGTVTGSTDDDGTDLRIPLADATVTDGAVTVQLRTTLTPVDDGWCHDPLDTVTSTLRDAAVAFSGTPSAPRNLADALPSVLRSLTVAVPDNPDESVQAAVLETVTAVTAQYRSQHPTVRVIPLSQVADAGTTTRTDAAYTRTVVIPGDTSDDGMTLEQPGTDDARIVLHGTGDELLDQARLLTADRSTDATAADLSGLLDSTSADAGAADVVLAPQARTLTDLGAADLTASGVGSAQVTFGIDQGDLGRLAGATSLHLTGNHTPLVDGITSGEVTVAVNGTVVDRTTAAGDGVLDRQIDLPDDLAQRYNTVTVTFAMGGQQADCGTTAPVELRIDGSSVVSSTDATEPTPLTAGFQGLPQAFLPEVDVVLADGGVTDLDRAARILAGLQETTAARVRPVPAELEETVESDRPVLVVDADGDHTDEATGGDPLPVTYRDGVLSVDGRDAETDTSYGAVQTRWDTDHRRMQVIATSTGEPQLLDTLLVSLDRATASGDGTGWADLRGTAVLQQESGTPREVGVPVDDGSDVGSTSSTGSADSGPGTTAVLAVLAAVVAAVALLFTVLGTVSRRGNPGSDQDER
ncbi:cellulose biosynthesis cyclic di-GMP-binding regulatory protein BcsB [Corynebacterium variabile]|uniref:Membrane protein n=1 Tax=Corynebacterium variabile TaxID=1727 RepID=A0A4Y4C7L0_9CORY|nr:cellulose biosynthesis cyclic di-GMP-binding regulatory protein BcsB [Corynebacterium variabile]GEC87153.1 membrane protein [Corynebacterium variabile]